MSRCTCPVVTYRIPEVKILGWDPECPQHWKKPRHLTTQYGATACSSPSQRRYFRDTWDFLKTEGWLLLLVVLWLVMVLVIFH